MALAPGVFDQNAIDVAAAWEVPSSSLSAVKPPSLPGVAPPTEVRSFVPFGESVRLSRPPVYPVRVSRSTRTAYQEAFEPPGGGEGTTNYGPDAEEKFRRSVLGLDPTLNKCSYVSVAHEFLPSPPKAPAAGRPKRELTMVERVREREFTAALEAAKMPVVTDMTTENRNAFARRDTAHCRSMPTLSPQDAARKEAQRNGVLALDPAHHNMKGSTSMTAEKYQNWGAHLQREADRRDRPISAMQQIQDRDRAAVLSAVAQGKRQAVQAAAAGPKATPTEYCLNFQGRQMDHSKDHNVVTKGLGDDDMATRGSLGTRVLKDVNPYWVDARRKRGVLGLKQQLRPIRSTTTNMETYQDTSGHLQRAALQKDRPLTMTEKINARDHKALMEQVERMRLEGLRPEIRNY